MTVLEKPECAVIPTLETMPTITVTDDLDLTKYDPEELVTARLQTPFLFDDDEEAQRLDSQRLRKAEQDLQELLTPDQRDRRAEHRRVRARIEFEQYKKMVDDMGDPSEVQAKITAMSEQPRLKDITEKMFKKPESPLSGFRPPRASTFTEKQLKDMGASPRSLKPKKNKTQDQLDSLVKITTDHRNVLKASAEIMGNQLSELQIANGKLQEQVDKAEARSKKADAEAAGSKFWARFSGIAAAISILVAIGIPTIQHFTAGEPNPAPQPSIEQEAP